MTIAIYGSKRQKDNLQNINSLLTSLSAAGARLVFHSKLYRHLVDLLGGVPSCWNVYSVTDSTRFSADLALSIGGDGTFLRTAHWVGDKQIPIAGVNAGHLGFLTSFSIENVDELVHNLFSGKFRIESRTRLTVDNCTDQEGLAPTALNDIVILKGDSASMVTINAEIDNGELAEYLADGLIIATATGSTGYNLSVGGPILQPTTPSFVITPIAAHSLTMRPLVVSDNSVIRMKITSRAESFVLSIDGKAYHFRSGETVTVRKSNSVVRILLPDNETFAHKLRDKLLWGVR